MMVLLFEKRVGKVRQLVDKNNHVLGIIGLIADLVGLGSLIWIQGDTVVALEAGSSLTFPVINLSVSSRTVWAISLALIILGFVTLLMYLPRHEDYQISSQRRTYLLQGGRREVLVHEGGFFTIYVALLSVAPVIVLWGRIFFGLWKQGEMYLVVFVGTLYFVIFFYGSNYLYQRFGSRMWIFGWAGILMVYVTALGLEKLSTGTAMLAATVTVGALFGSAFLINGIKDRTIYKVEEIVT